ncbi:hypothetical protein SDC9_58986 [bioreactor metagenome]|uniref:ATPase AAA-type core domain-containing protein n=1 Tax=bioreactor metagenome TaxID=1076179 RepID=A0A644X8Z3_9ZZZZ
MNPEVFSGLEMYEKLKNMLLGSRSERTMIADFEKFISTSLFEDQQVELIPNNEKNVIFVKIGNEKERAIYDLGDGIQSAIILTFLPFIYNEPSFFFIEEPEMFLHPGLQRKILNFYSSRKSHIFFITTHSNHLLDLTADFQDVSVYTLRKQLEIVDDNEEIDPKFILETVNDSRNSSLELLGVRNSSVFLVNATIWVEGITDRKYFRKYLELYIGYRKENGLEVKRIEEDVHYCFVEYGGSNITHWSFIDDDNEEIEVETLCGRALVIADSDDGAKQERKEKLRRKLGERFIELPCREVENLLPYHVIKAVIEDYEGGKDIDFPDYDYEDYKKSYLGEFIHEKIFGDKKMSRRGGYKEDSGTIKSKLSFCENSLSIIDKDVITFEMLPEDTKKTIDAIYNFIVSQNQ